MALTLRAPVSDQPVIDRCARGREAYGGKAREAAELGRVPSGTQPSVKAAPTQPHSPAVTTQSQCGDSRLLPKAPEFPCHKMK